MRSLTLHKTLRAWDWGMTVTPPVWSLFSRCRLGGEGLVWSSSLLLASPRRDHIYSLKLTLPASQEASGSRPGH